MAEAFRRSAPRLRSPEVMPDTRVRDFVRAWHGGARLTSNGFWKVQRSPAPSCVDRCRLSCHDPNIAAAAAATANLSAAAAALNELGPALGRLVPAVWCTPVM